MAGSTNDFSLFYCSELELIEPFETLEDKVSEVKEVIFTQFDTMQYGLEAMHAEDCAGQLE